MNSDRRNHESKWEVRLGALSAALSTLLDTGTVVPMSAFAHASEAETELLVAARRLRKLALRKKPLAPRFCRSCMRLLSPVGTLSFQDLAFQGMDFMHPCSVFLRQKRKSYIAY